MLVEVTYIKNFGTYKKGDKALKHPAMVKHLQKIGVVEGDKPAKSILSETKPIVLTNAEPVNLTHEVEEVKEVKIALSKEPKKPIKRKRK